jgi:acyl-CoA reductase-like NAD-dependent aldehyde dehydrogenase
VSSEKEAIELVNDSDLGLTGGVFTKDAERSLPLPPIVLRSCRVRSNSRVRVHRAKRVLGQYNTGTAYWNCCDRVAPALPWSGRNFSGLGATLGVEGIRAFTVPKAWHLVSPQ